MPRLLVVTGPAGSGKTTLAHALARTVGCPAVCRDEIKEGMVDALSGEYEAGPGDSLTRRASEVFFQVVESLLEAGTTTVAEAAFQDPVWRPNLLPLADRARIRVIRCSVHPVIGRQRMSDRSRRRAHTDVSVIEDPRYYDTFVPVSLQVPTLDLDTSDGYDPALDEIVSFTKG